MSDFETLLERLLLDSAFKAALAADPGRALVGYTLTDEERGLLMTELSADAGRSSRVEERTSKAALFGLLGAAAEMFSTPGGGPGYVDSGDIAPSDGEKPWAGVIKLNPGDIPEDDGRRDGAVSVADFQMSAKEEHKFFHGLVTEMDMPALDAASKDPAYLTLDGGDAARGGGFAAPQPDDFKPAPDAANFKLPLDSADIKLPPDPSEIKLAPPPGDIKLTPEGIKLAPSDIKLAPSDIKLAPAPDTAPPFVIKMVPDEGFKAPSSFDPPAPIEPELPHK